MNNEKMNQMIDEAYKNYRNAFVEGHVHEELDECLSVEEFINECKTDNEFSEKWGLKIEERELDMMERWQLAELTPNMTEFDFANYMCDKFNVPTRLITITYNSIKTDIYE